jgi:hypothetical protein
MLVGGPGEILVVVLDGCPVFIDGFRSRVEVRIVLPSHRQAFGNDQPLYTSIFNEPSDAVFCANDGHIAQIKGEILELILWLLSIILA